MATRKKAPVRHRAPGARRQTDARSRQSGSLRITPADTATGKGIIRFRFSRVLESYRDGGVADLRRSAPTRVRRAH